MTWPRVGTDFNRIQYWVLVTVGIVGGPLMATEAPFPINVLGWLAFGYAVLLGVFGAPTRVVKVDRANDVPPYDDDEDEEYEDGVRRFKWAADDVPPDDLERGQMTLRRDGSILARDFDDGDFIVVQPAKKKWRLK